ncbi:hypothetical protein ACFYNO_22500 [Kitasatospora sp. NPDC006697]|uniref:hypothetical protein n=1 Tax=Kitasatospora sp. NPDC006697 TaxID=3364020 RepID=UPI0036CBAD63
MDPELIDLARAAGAAVASSAGTDAWREVREKAARLVQRGRERLDRTAAEVASAGPGGVEQAAASWQTRFQDLLEELDDAGRAQVVAQLRELVALSASARDHGTVIIGDVHIESSGNAIAVLRMGDLTIRHPPPPRPAQD